MPKIRTLFISIAIVLLAATLCQARDLAIVINKSNATASVTGAELEKLLKAGTPNWPDGKKVKIFLTDPGSSDSKTILQRVYKMAPAEIRSLLDAHKAEVQV